MANNGTSHGDVSSLHRSLCLERGCKFCRRQEKDNAIKHLFREYMRSEKKGDAHLAIVRELPQNGVTEWQKIA